MKSHQPAAFDDNKHVVVGTPISATEMKTLIHRQNEFLSKVFAWMFCGLALTASIAYYCHTSTTVDDYLTKHRNVLGLILIAELMCVVFVKAAVYRTNRWLASSLFIAYSAANGVTLSPFLHIYTEGSVFLAFGIAAAVFFTMATYGYVTKRDLTAPGSLAASALWGVLLAMIVNIILRSPFMDWCISIIVVFLFIGLIAYDTQALKNMTLELASEDEMETVAIAGALLLYLDFLNLFLHILKLIGKKR